MPVNSVLWGVSFHRALLCTVAPPCFFFFFFKLCGFSTVHVSPCFFFFFFDKFPLSSRILSKHVDSCRGEECDEMQPGYSRRWGFKKRCSFKEKCELHTCRGLLAVGTCTNKQKQQALNGRG